MIKFLKIVLLFFLFGTLIFCHYFDIDDEIDCSEGSYSFSGLKLGTYYRNPDTNYFHGVKYGYDGFPGSTPEVQIPYTEKFSFYEDGNFSYLMIGYENEENDTIKILNGKVETYKDGKYPWYVLKLSADSIYEKQIIIDTLNVKINISANFMVTEFLGFTDSLLVDKKDSVYKNCFALGRYKPCNDKYLFSSVKTFCLKQPEE